MNIEYFELPTYWACALVNNDNSDFGPEEEASLDSFVQWMQSTYGQCWCLNVEDDARFSRYHDASRFGVLACDVTTFAFDVSCR